MSFSKKIKERIHLSFIGIKHVIGKPRYLIITFVITIVFSIIIYLLINSNFYIPLLSSHLSLTKKIEIVGELFFDTIRNYFHSFSGALIGIVSLAQGISLSVTFYTLKQNRVEHLKSRSETSSQINLSGLAAIAAAIGLGCVPCGTSLILPIVMIFFSGSAVAVAANIASTIILIIALLLSMYSIYRIGYIAYTHSLCEKLNDNKELL